MIALPKPNISPESRLSQKETSLPTIHFQVRALSFRQSTILGDKWILRKHFTSNFCCLYCRAEIPEMSTDLRTSISGPLRLVYQFAELGLREQALRTIRSTPSSSKIYMARSKLVQSMDQRIPSRLANQFNH